MTPHSVTGVSPNMAMLAREVLLPTSLGLIARPPEEPLEVTTPFVQKFRNNIRAAHQTIRESTRKAARTQKCYFDKFVKGPPFAVNQKVWLYWLKALLRHKGIKIRSLRACGRVLGELSSSKRQLL